MWDYGIEDGTGAWKRETGAAYTATYDNFRVGSEDEGYKLSLSGYDETSTLADAFTAGGHNGQRFSTFDSHDNDVRSGCNCASDCNTDFSGGIVKC